MPTEHKDDPPAVSTPQAADEPSSLAGGKPQALLREVRQGLSQNPKRLPSKLFYDHRGSELFDQITKLPEYYPTRTEAAILEEHAADMARRIGPQACLVEFGAGNSAKTRILLDQLSDAACYAPMDISGDFLRESAEALAEAYPHIPIVPICADFTRPFELPDSTPRGRRIAVFFPGSTIGNLLPAEAVELLRGVRRLIGDTGCLLLGTDTCRDEPRLHDAYNDAAGVTAEFNLNLLNVVNREVGTDFDPDKFEHKAVFNPERGRVEMRLVSVQDQVVQLNGEAIPIAEGEQMVTEYSHKLRRAEVERMAAEAGLRVEHVWRDKDEIFGVYFLTARAPD